MSVPGVLRFVEKPKTTDTRKNRHNNLTVHESSDRFAANNALSKTSESRGAKPWREWPVFYRLARLFTTSKINFVVRCLSFPSFAHLVAVTRPVPNVDTKRYDAHAAVALQNVFFRRCKNQHRVVNPVVLRVLPLLLFASDLCLNTRLRTVRSTVGSIRVRSLSPRPQAFSRKLFN